MLEPRPPLQLLHKGPPSLQQCRCAAHDQAARDQQVEVEVEVEPGPLTWSSAAHGCSQTVAAA